MSSGSNNAISTIDDNEARLGIGGTIAQAQTVSSAIQLASALVDRRIATARAYPRSISRFKREASDLLREDIETARQAEYSKPVGGGTVRGPSVRLAELAAMCWGNLDVEVYDPIVGDKSVSVKAAAWDLERNNREEAVVTTSILDKRGQRYPAHLVETTCLATASKARRNAILLIIPRAYIQDLLQVAKAVAAGNEKSLEQTRIDMLDYFARTYKVQPEQIFALLAVEGLDDIGQEGIDELRAIVTAIKEGSSPDEFFATKAASKADELKAKIAERQKAQAATEQPAQIAAPAKPVTPPPETPAKATPSVEWLMSACRDLAKRHDCEVRDAIAVVFQAAKIDAPSVDDLTAAQLGKACEAAQAKLAEPLPEKPKGKAKPGKAGPGKLIGEPEGQKMPD